MGAFQAVSDASRATAFRECFFAFGKVDLPPLPARATAGRGSLAAPRLWCVRKKTGLGAKTGKGWIWPQITQITRIKKTI